MSVGRQRVLFHTSTRVHIEHSCSVRKLTAFTGTSRDTPVSHSDVTAEAPIHFGDHALDRPWRALAARSLMLEFDHVSRSFGDLVALQDLTFTVQSGALCGFCGPNGAGKTTAMRVLVGILRADAGEVRWRDDPVDRELCRRFGYLPEERGLYPAMEVRDHLIYLARLRGLAKERARRATDRLLDAFGVTAMAHRRIDSLSLGNAQRVQLASALVHDPVLIALDEPFNGLDPLAAEQLASLLRERVAAGATVLFSSHQLDTVERLCDTVVVLDRGRCVLSGGLSDLTHPLGRRRRTLLDAYRAAIEPDPVERDA